MTHDKLLLLIDTNSGGYLSKGNFVPLDEEVLGFVYALRAVVKLHKPQEIKIEGELFDQCVGCRRQYPCPTIQAIEEQLK